MATRLAAERVGVKDQKAEMSNGPALGGEPIEHMREAVLSEWLNYAQATLSAERRKSALIVVRLENYFALAEALSPECIELVMDELDRRLRQSVPSGTQVIKWAEREFVVFPRSAMPLSTVHRLAGNLRKGLDAPLSISGTAALALTTIGAVQIDELSINAPRMVLNRLDQALARAARLSEDRFSVYDHRHAESARHHLEMQSALHAALHNEELSLVYQPIRELTTDKVIAVEALARWNDPRLGEIPPSVFIPAAEEAGLMGVLEKWVVRTACRQLSEWRGDGFFDLMMSVNVSATQFTTREFGLEEPILSALDEYDLPPAALQIEITETAVSEGAERTMLRSIQRLSQLGARFIIDDFGTGHSSLSRIHRLPVQGIKIDRSFVCGLSRCDSSRKVVAAIIALAGELDLEVIAEGVERNLHRQALVELGCSLGQGYLVGRPFSPADVPEFIAASPGRHNTADDRVGQDASRPGG